MRNAEIEEFARSVEEGLQARPRRLDSRWLYDARGSELFEAITRVPEYYPTRAETEILARHAREIRAICGSGTLVELGSGSSTKTRLLLEAWCAFPGAHYAPVDTCSAALEEAAAGLRGTFPTLEITGVHGGFEDVFPRLGAFSPVTVAFLGSTIGNFEDPGLDQFLSGLASHLDAGDHFLLGIDLVKDPEVLEAAYDDAAGVTAEFTRNLFHRMNRELGTSIDVDQVRHHARWNPELEQIEIDAEFLAETRISLRGAAQTFTIAAGERIRTEVSRKFRVEGMQERLAHHGFEPAGAWLDEERRFALLLGRRSASPHRDPRGTQDAAAELARSRARLLEITSLLTESQLAAQHDPLMSPVLWDLGHVANFEEQWIDEASGRMPDADRSVRDERYDAVRHTRASRVDLLLPTATEARRELARVRARTEALLAKADGQGEEPLLADNYVFHMLSQHEAQHAETILQAIGLIREEVRFAPPDNDVAERRAPAAAREEDEMVAVPGGTFRIGTNDRSRAYDNERPAHPVTQEAFRIARHPVTNAAYRAFIEDGGYDHPDFWSTEGDQWRLTSGCRAPMRWFRAAGAWWENHFGRREPLNPQQPVVHVCFFEAEAFARWSGKRLPTEVEWEIAATFDPQSPTRRTFPWGETPPDFHTTDLDSRQMRPSSIGSHPAGRSALGCEDLVGSVWEWTSSEFRSWPGFEAFPYPEYSAVHFDRGYRVLRGGSWATQAVAIRNTFRNWDLPQRRQLMAGIRLADDAGNA